MEQHFLFLIKCTFLINQSVVTRIKLFSAAANLLSNVLLLTKNLSLLRPSFI